MTYPAEFLDAVELLDRKVSDWWKEGRINLDTLDMNSYTNCILGQLFGSYSVGLNELNIINFNSLPFGKYTEEWRQFIIHRRQEDKTKEKTGSMNNDKTIDKQALADFLNGVGLKVVTPVALRERLKTEFGLPEPKTLQTMEITLRIPVENLDPSLPRHEACRWLENASKEELKKLVYLASIKLRESK